MTFPVTVTRLTATQLQNNATAWNNAWDAVTPEIDADWGSMVNMDVPSVVNRMTVNGWVILIARNGNPGLRGANIFVPQDDGSWLSAITATDKSLAAADRLSVFWQMMQFGASRVTPTTVVFGTVKAGGNLDNYLDGRVPNRTVSPDGLYATYSWTAQQILAVAA